LRYSDVMDPLFRVTAPELRRLLEELMPTDSEYDAFVLDYFPAVKKRSPSGMDRIAKTNLLLESINQSLICSKLREAFPDVYRYMITIESGADAGRKYPLPSEGSIRIGRDASCEIVILERWVSRRHAVLELRRRDVTLIKEGKFPIYRNGVEVLNRTFLVSDDRIKINETTLQFHGPAPAGPAQTVSSLEPTPAYDPLASFRESSSAPAAPAAKASTAKDYYLFWGLTDRLLAMNRLDEAERMIGPRCAELRKCAEAGEVLEGAVILEALKFALKLAIATKKDRWFAWIFELATICEYKMDAAFLTELYPPISAIHPGIGVQIDLYSQIVASETTRLHLILLRRECSR
jgi:hypothetical protein